MTNTPAQNSTVALTPERKQLTTLRQEQLHLAERHQQLNRMFSQVQKRRDKLSKQLAAVGSRETELAREVFALTRHITKLKLGQSAFKKPGKIVTAAQHLANRRAGAKATPAESVKALVGTMSAEEKQELIKSLQGAV